MIFSTKKTKIPKDILDKKALIIGILTIYLFTTYIFIIIISIISSSTAITPVS